MPGDRAGVRPKAVAVVPDATGNGYWLVTQKGGVHVFGDAKYYGGLSTTNGMVTSAVRTPDGGGYWVLTSDGTVHAFGDALNFGSLTASMTPTNPGLRGRCDVRRPWLLGRGR